MSDVFWKLEMISWDIKPVYGYQFAQRNLDVQGHLR